MAELSEYERQRQANIMELQNEYSDLFDNVGQSVIDLAKTSNVATEKGENNGRQNYQSWIKRKMFSKSSTPKTPTVVRRSARILKEQSTSLNYNEESEESDEDKKIQKSKKGSIVLKFSWFKSIEHEQKDKIYYSGLTDEDFIDDDYDIDYEPRLKRKRSKGIFTPRLTVSQVTQEMLDNITYSSSSKKYSSDGTTCHQCRQKTLDQKSYCRHKLCVGVRGMFCGFCLGNRYGEDVAVVLKDPKWACPPCRGYCNCSICRRKQGRCPTGQLSQRAIADGYKSVRHFLSVAEGETTSETVSDEYEDDEDNNHQPDDNSTTSGNNDELDSDVQHKIMSEEEFKNDNLKINNDNVNDTDFQHNMTDEDNNSTSGKNELNDFQHDIKNKVELLKQNKIKFKNFCCEDDSIENCELHIRDEDDIQTIIDKYYKQLLFKEISNI